MWNIPEESSHKGDLEDFTFTDKNQEEDETQIRTRGTINMTRLNFLIQS